MKIEDFYYKIPEETVDDNDFDIEKWRKESPMDYFKAMFLINSSLNKDEVFQTIYKVTRLYIPNILFKYYSLTDNIALNEQKFETLLQKKIFMSDTRDLNDPFDSKSYFYRTEELRKYERLDKCEGKLFDFPSYSKISSLTSNGVSSMPMWAHYANNHTGYCVSYDMKINTELSSCTFPIQYIDQRIDVTTLINQQVKKMIYEIEIQSKEGKREILFDDMSLVFLISFFCNIKHISWSYENEFRCTTGAIAQGMPYILAAPKEIYVGMNCLPTYIDTILKIAQKLQVPVYRMTFDELNEDFNLIPQKIC